jgi:hypothetical protein
MVVITDMRVSAGPAIVHLHEHEWHIRLAANTWKRSFLQRFVSISCRKCWLTDLRQSNYLACSSFEMKIMNSSTAQAQVAVRLQ